LLIHALFLVLEVFSLRRLQMEPSERERFDMRQKLIHEILPELGSVRHYGCVCTKIWLKRETIIQKWHSFSCVTTGIYSLLQ
jgi:hypothetical protein